MHAIVFPIEGFREFLTMVFSAIDFSAIDFSAIDFSAIG